MKVVPSSIGLNTKVRAWVRIVVRLAFVSGLYSITHYGVAPVICQHGVQLDSIDSAGDYKYGCDKNDAAITNELSNWKEVCTERKY
jgi:hypothetical protein